MKLQDPSCPANVYYISNPKSWMTSEVMEAVLARFNRKLVWMLASSKISRSSTERGWLNMCSQGSRRMDLQHKFVKGVDVLVAIRWLQEAWKEVTSLTIKNCFEKCDIKGDNEQMEVEEDDDLEFEALVKEFTMGISAEEYTNFDKNVPASEPMINEFEID